MVGGFIRVAVTPRTGAIGLYYIAVIKKLNQFVPVVTRDMAGFTKVSCNGVLRAFLRYGMATGADTVGLQDIVMRERQAYRCPHAGSVTHTTDIRGLRMGGRFIRHRVTAGGHTICGGRLIMGEWQLQRQPTGIVMASFTHACSYRVSLRLISFAVTT